jgi:magnesium-transporting ATPase (P-type)
MTAFFGFFIFASVFNSFNARTYRLNLLAHIRKNHAFVAVIAFIFLTQLALIYYGGSLFRTTGLSASELRSVILLAFSVIPADLLRKITLRLNGRKGNL